MPKQKLTIVPVTLLLLTFYLGKKLTEPFVYNLTEILTEIKGKPLASPLSNINLIGFVLF